MPEYTALLLAAEVGDESDFERLMLLLRQWSDQAQPSGVIELTIRVDALDLIIEQTSPVEGHSAILALFADIVESVRLLQKSDLLHQVTRILITPLCLHSDVRADIGDRPAYLIAPRRGTV
jgi:hypothetical protein